MTDFFPFVIWCYWHSFFGYFRLKTCKYIQDHNIQLFAKYTTVWHLNTRLFGVLPLFDHLPEGVGTQALYIIIIIFAVGQKLLGTNCPQKRCNGRPCRGKLCDFVLDWEAELPDNDLDLSNAHSTLADLSIVIGSTLQVLPLDAIFSYFRTNLKNRLLNLLA